MCTTFVGYLRVSTDRQGKSGLGLEAQLAAVAHFVATRGANARLLKMFTEIESGTCNDNRPELEAAKGSRQDNRLETSDRQIGPAEP